MKIKELKLFTKNVKKQKEFYHNILGFDLISNQENKFTIKVGFTKLTFIKSKIDYKYHYCFLIPSNKLEESIEWLKKRLKIVKIENKKETQFFASWNAESVYFYDGVGNLAEFIVRYDLKNETTKAFNSSQIISVNEIGMPSNNVNKLNQQLEKQINSKFWRGNLERFATNGNQNGLFLLVNNEIKKEWFPTTLFPESAPFEAIVEVHKNKFKLEFKNQILKIN